MHENQLDVQFLFILTLHYQRAISKQGEKSNQRNDT